ncbi:thioredoxin domain-containing protein [soil metagenome]
MSTALNHLANTHSPYLQQHAENPVDWYPWGDEALQRAKVENKPILLSIGYAACHWCHVMAHESFEDELTAKLMNQYFINIKVDREERPDIDKVYQLTHQLLNGRGGGWPLTVFLNPKDCIPFFSGTYFPSEPRYGMPAFRQILQEIANFYVEHPKELKGQNQQLQLALQQLVKLPSKNHKVQLSAAPLSGARQQLTRAFDAVHGGFGSAPKFPQWNNIEYLLQHWAETKRLDEDDKRAVEIVSVSLEKMVQGGIYDHVGGGFFRYSVDAAWEIPHFEKMLYDNAQALTVYAQAYAALKNPLYAEIANETAGWMLREMQATQGGFYATLDADSEGDEGKYYVWDRDELKLLLTSLEYQVVQAYFGLENLANFETKWHLHVLKKQAEIARSKSLSVDEVRALLQSARQKLLQARELRIKPRLDDKILTAWNALAIKALTLAGLQLSRTDFLAAAERALNFIRQNCWVKGRLMAVYKETTNNKGTAYQSAYLDDYAFLLDALLIRLQAHWSSEDLQFAIALAENLLTYFEDKTSGGFFFTAHDQETLIQRPKGIMDEAIPAGNGIAASALIRLGHLIGDRRYITAAEHTLEFAWPMLQTTAASAHMSLLMALELHIKPAPMVVIRGDMEEIAIWQQTVMQRYYPHCICVAIPRDITDLPASLAACKPRLSCVVAYICQGLQCSAPVSELKELLAILQEG